MTTREIDPAALEPRAVYALLTQLVVPRPIAWVSTLAADGTRNLAPHSYYNIVSSEPPVVHFTSAGDKDTLRNARASGEFVVNVVDRALAEAMNVTAANFPPGEDEFAWAGLTPAPSTHVTTPRVAEASVAFDVQHRETRDYGTADHPSFLIVGDVLHIRIHEHVLGGPDGSRVLPEHLRDVARMGGAATYARTTDRFELARPRWDPERETITQP